MKKYIIIAFLGLIANCSDEEIRKPDNREQVTGLFEGKYGYYSCYKDSGNPSVNYYTGIFEGGNYKDADVLVKKNDSGGISIQSVLGTFSFKDTSDFKDSSFFYVYYDPISLSIITYMHIIKDSICIRQGKLGSNSCSHPYFQIIAKKVK